MKEQIEVPTDCARDLYGQLADFMEEELRKDDCPKPHDVFQAFAMLFVSFVWNIQDGDIAKAMWDFHQYVGIFDALKPETKQ